jgi:large subunit ribosomal protein L17
MRHGKAGRKLGRQKDQRIALRKNLIKQLFEHERIETTRAKAEAIRGQAEKLITLAKRGNSAYDEKPEYTVHTRRLAVARLGDKSTVQKLFDEIAPRYDERKGGYTRMLKLGPRNGDSSEMVILELVE